MAINIYASSVAKSVFVWIYLILLMVGWYFTIVGVKIMSNKLSNVAEKGIKYIPNAGTAASVLYKVAKYGGIALFISSISLLILIELTWKPQRNIK